MSGGHHPNHRQNIRERFLSVISSVVNWLYIREPHSDRGSKMSATIMSVTPKEFGPITVRSDGAAREFILDKYEPVSHQ